MFKKKLFPNLTSIILCKRICLIVILSLLITPLSFGQSVPQKKEQMITQNQIILKLKPIHKFNISTNKRSLGLQAIDQIAKKQGTYTVQQIGLSTPKTTKKNRPNFKNIVVLKYDSDINIKEAIKDFEASDMVEYAEPNGIMYGSTKVIEDRMAELGYEAPQITPNDQYYSAQWWSENDGTYHNNYQVPSYFPTCEVDADIDLEAAWDITTGCSSVVIALLDTGMKLDHPEMAGRIIGGTDFVNDDDDPTDDNGHGSNVGGIAFATGNDGGIHAGVNWSSDVLIVKVLDEQNLGAWVDLADGIIWAVDNGATIMNASIGGQNAPQVLEDAVQYAYDNNVAIIVSSGNDNGNVASYPAAYSQTISVGATTCNDARVNNNTWGSNYHSTVDLVAPGSSIYGLRHDSNDWGYWWGGTSQATPMVTGVASLMLCIDPNLSVEDIRTILRNTAEDQVGKPSEDTPGYDIYHGAGRLNAEAALLSISDCDDAQVGTPCDDNDACTTNDVYNEFCVCTGTLQDADNDNVCDAEDQCPGFDDNIDIDEDGIPDNCDPDVDCSGIVCNDNNNCTVNDVYDSNCNCSGVSIDNNGNCNISDLYCEPTTNQAGLFIEKVVIGNIDNQSGSDDGYGDYSNQYALLTAPGETINAELVLNEDTGFGNNWTVWIDFNQNSTFEDSEKVIEGNGIQLNTTFTIPANASIGTTLMRVLGNIVLFGGTNPCDAGIAGEFEDYSVIIGNDAACTPGDPCDDSDACTINDVLDANCNCAGTNQDSDDDGVCDADDTCPGFDNNLIGTACDDSNACTTGETYDTDCNCTGGTFQDADNDGVCDADDVCPDGDDEIDSDGDGTPDACDEEDCSVGTPCNDNDDCTVFDILNADCECVGIFADNDNDGVCDEDDICPNGNDNIDSDGDGIPDACDDDEEECTVGSPCDDNDDCTVFDTLNADCECVGVFADNDNDGVCDEDDICPNGNDNIDSDGDGTPDACDDDEEECFIGMPCDDGDDCTIYEYFDVDCNCVGVYLDIDNDGICDADDACPIDPQNNCEEEEGYCLPTVFTSLHRYISNVNFGSIDNDSQYDNGGYADYTSLSTNLSAGSTVNISLTTDGNIPAFVTHAWGVWIDYNKDGDFDDFGEEAFTTLSTASTTTATIAIPANIADGTTRMRVIVNYGSSLPTPCGDIIMGEIEDYTVQLSGGGNGCNAGTPCNDGDDCTINDVLDADCNCDGTYNDSDNDNICDADDDCPLDPANNCGSVPDYCDSYGNNTDYEYIDRVAFGDIDNASGDDGGYGDYTNHVATVGLGDAVPIGLAPGFTGHAYNEVWTVWIDFDQDGHYGIHEQVYFGIGAGSLSGHVTIPPNATLGQTGMRVAMQWGRPANPCESFTYGEVEDYVVNITDSPQNYPLVNLRNEDNLVASPSIRIHPNPATDFININLQNARDNGSMAIITLSGKTVMQQDINVDTNDFKVAVNQLPAGVYLIRLDLGGNTYVTERFVKLSH